MTFFVLATQLDLSVSDAATECRPLEPANFGEAPKCPACRRFIGMRPWLPPHQVELETWGEQFGDLAGRVGDDLLVSDKMKKGIDAFGITGLVGFNQVTIQAINSHREIVQKQPLYYRVGVCPSEAAVDFVKSEVEGDGSICCPVCLDIGLIKRAKRIILGSENLPTEDVFRPRGLPGMILCSERFRRCCIEAKLKNVTVFPAQDYHFDFYPWERD